MASSPEESDFHPRHTATLLGQGAAEAELMRAWGSGRMPHAWLLAGPRGIGKATLAYRFARTVLAHRESAGPSLFGAAPSAPAGPIGPEHPVFRRVAAQAHPDLCVVTTTVNQKTGKMREEIVVEDARAAINFFAHTSAEGGWRVAIIDAADELNEESANALLKVIEEPPERGLVLLVTHRPGFVLPTIRSRTRLVRMKPLDAGDIARVVSEQWPELPAPDVHVLLNMAEGSPGRAIQLAEADGVGFYREFQTFLHSLPNPDVALMHALADRVGKREVGRGFRVLATLPEWWMVRAIRSHAGRPPALEVLPGEIEGFSRVLGRRTLEHWVAVWEKVSLFLAQGIALNLDRRQMALNVLTILGLAARG